MKSLFYSVIVTTIIATGCKNKETETTTNGEPVETTAEKFACPMHPEVTGNKGDECPKCGMELSEPVAVAPANDNETTTTTASSGTASTSFSVDPLLDKYLQLKNALTKDDSKAAATAGKDLFAALNAVSPSSIDAKNSKEYTEIADDAKEHAEHIADNSGKIAHQREHFAMLSKDVNDLVKMFGAGREIYQDFCPMFNDGKGAIWISETKDIKNPYYGAEMLTCGELKKEL